MRMCFGERHLSCAILTDDAYQSLDFVATKKNSEQLNFPVQVKILAFSKFVGLK